LPAGDGGDTITIAIFETMAVMPESNGSVARFYRDGGTVGRTRGGNADGEASDGLALMNGAVLEE